MPLIKFIADSFKADFHLDSQTVAEYEFYGRWQHCLSWTKSASPTENNSKKCCLIHMVKVTSLQNFFSPYLLICFCMFTALASSSYWILCYSHLPIDHKHVHNKIVFLCCGKTYLQAGTLGPTINQCMEQKPIKNRQGATFLSGRNSVGNGSRYSWPFGE